MSNPVLDAALGYVARGWLVLPVKPRDKLPTTAHGKDDATMNAAMVRKWWEQSPNANIGIATGAGSGFFVLDVDAGKHGFESLAELEAKHGQLPNTLTAITGGGGRHILFAHPGRKVGNRAGIAPGLDVRGDGGYIVAAPSEHASGKRYAWKNAGTPIAEAPTWLLKLICGEPKSTAPEETSRQSISGNGHSAYVEAAVRNELEEMAHAVEGSRNDQLFRSAAALGGLVGAGVLDRTPVENDLMSTAKSTGLTEPEIKRTIRSGIEKGMREPRTVLHNGNGNHQHGDTTHDADKTNEDALDGHSVLEMIALLAKLHQEERGKGMRTLFIALGKLDAYELQAITAKVITDLGIGKREFDKLLTAARRKNGQPQLNGDRYRIEDGSLCAVGFDHTGLLRVEPLCNFIARIVAEEERDDGQERTRHFVIEGTASDGAPLSKARVTAAEFDNVAKWSVKSWGSRAVVRAGQSTRDRLREAIQLVSIEAGIETRRVFTHTGWTKVGDSHVYLTATGALGLEGISVELEGDLARYALPRKIEDARGAMRTSLKFLEVADRKITFPLWSVVYLAPLTPFIEPDFVPWLYGRTGSFKSVLAALALCHFGQFDYEHMPARWSSTKNEIERWTFLAKDTLLCVDDFAPQAFGNRAQDMEDSAHRIVRAVGNRAGRGRLNRDTSLRAPNNPRGVVIATGEQLPSGHSIMARLLSIEMNAGMVDIQKVTTAQDEAVRYPHAMAGYISWIAPQFVTLAKELPALFRDVRQKEISKGHARLPSIFALLHIGLDVALQYAVEVGALTPSQSDELLKEGDGVLRTVIAAHGERIEAERPTLRFLRVLQELQTQRAIHLCDLDKKDDQGILSGELIGWQDTNHIYLLPAAAYHRVAAFCRNEGGFFPVKSNALYRDLEAEGFLVTIRGKHTGTERIGDNTHHVLKLLRNKVGAALQGSAENV